MKRNFAIFLLFALIIGAMPLTCLAGDDILPEEAVSGELDTQDVPVAEASGETVAPEVHIRAELDRYESTVDYSERYEISVRLRTYIQESGLDTTLPGIRELVEINNGHIEELISMEEEYSRLTEKNSYLFIECAERLKVTEDYIGISALLEEGRYYFFNMDVSVAGIDEAISVYESKLSDRHTMEKNAKAFIDEVAYLSFAFESGDKLSLIIDAYHAFRGVDTGVDGVLEAYEILMGAMERYDSSVAPYNAELSESREAVPYMLNHEGCESFAAFILEFIG